MIGLINRQAGDFDFSKKSLRNESRFSNEKTGLFRYPQNRPVMRKFIPVLSAVKSLGNRFKAYAESPKYRNLYYKFLLVGFPLLNQEPPAVSAEAVKPQKHLPEVVKQRP